MKTLLIIVGSIISNRLLTQFLFRTAQPTARNLVRRSVKYSATVFTVCLIGALTFSAGLVMAFFDLAQQMSGGMGVYFSPAVGFGVGLIFIGGLFVYLGTFSNLLSPWRRLEAHDLHHQDDSLLTQVFEALSLFMETRSSGSKRTKEKARDSWQASDPLPREERYSQQDSVH